MDLLCPFHVFFCCLKCKMWFHFDPVARGRRGPAGEVQLGQPEADGPGSLRLRSGAPVQDLQGLEAAGKPHAARRSRRIGWKEKPAFQFLGLSHFGLDFLNRLLTFRSTIAVTVGFAQPWLRVLSGELTLPAYQQLKRHLSLVTVAMLSEMKKTVTSHEDF